VARVTPAHRAERLRRAVHEIGAVAAVNVQINEPRREVHSAEVDLGRKKWNLLDRIAGRDHAVPDEKRRVRHEPVWHYERRVRENRYSHFVPSNLPSSC